MLKWLKRLFWRQPKFKVTRITMDVKWNPRGQSNPKYWDWGLIANHIDLTIIDAVDRERVNK